MDNNDFNDYPIPFDGQRFVDHSRTVWEYDVQMQGWRRIGPVSDLPTANEVITGLLSAALKSLLDNIPVKGGGFGIVVKPYLALKSESNPDGIISGDVKFSSDSMNIGCVGPDGKPVPAGCCNVEYPIETSSGIPTITFKLSEEFLKTLCIELTSAPGPKGQKGDKGDPGADGTGDGPVGDKGNNGLDAIQPVKFTEIEIHDSDDIYDTAVTDLEIDRANGKMAVTKTKVRAPDNDTPASQLIVTPISRAIEFTEDFYYKITMPATDPIGKADASLLAYPTGYEPGGDQKETTTTAAKLSVLIDMIINDYKAKLDKIDADYSKQLKDFIIGKDKEVRQALNDLACNLAEAEWQQPIENCIGITPDDCHPDDGQPPPFGVSIAKSLFGYPFCSKSTAEELGIYEVTINAGVTLPAVNVLYPRNTGVFNSTTLPPGGYVIAYQDGTYEDPNKPEFGHFVGRPESNFGLEMEVIQAGSTQVIKFPSITSVTDAHSVEHAYKQAGIENKAMKVVLNSNGLIRLRARASTKNKQPRGTVIVRAYRILSCPLIVLQPSRLDFVNVSSGNPQPQTLMLTNQGDTTLKWVAIIDQPWLSLTPDNGNLDANSSTPIVVSVDTDGLADGYYSGGVTISAENAANTPQRASVFLNISASPAPPVTSSPPPEGAGASTLQFGSTNYTGNGGDIINVTITRTGMGAYASATIQVTTGSSTGTFTVSWNDGDVSPKVMPISTEYVAPIPGNPGASNGGATLKIASASGGAVVGPASTASLLITNGRVTGF